MPHPSGASTSPVFRPDFVVRVIVPGCLVRYVSALVVQAGDERGAPWAPDFANRKAAVSGRPGREAKAVSAAPGDGPAEVTLARLTLEMANELASLPIGPGRTRPTEGDAVGVEERPGTIWHHFAAGVVASPNDVRPTCVPQHVQVQQDRARVAE